MLQPQLSAAMSRRAPSKPPPLPSRGGAAPRRAVGGLLLLAAAATLLCLGSAPIFSVPSELHHSLHDRKQLGPDRFTLHGVDALSKILQCGSFVDAQRATEVGKPVFLPKEYRSRTSPHHLHYIGMSPAGGRDPSQGAYQPAGHVAFALTGATPRDGAFIYVG